jgi:uncharacterized membrane protein
MSELIVVGFDDPFDAQEHRLRLLRLQKAHLLDLEDAAVVVKSHRGKVKLEQSHNLPMGGAASGTFWGLLLGSLLMAPLVGAVVGAAAGAVAGKLADIGIDDAFMRELGETLQPGTSALFVLVRNARPEQIIEELRPFDGRILRTSLSTSDEDKLRATLHQAHRIEDATTPHPTAE